MNATIEMKTSLKKRAAIMLAAASITLSGLVMGSGMALAATINGTDGEDVLIGTRANDRMHGLDKNDEIRALAGDDLLRGDKGKDHLLGYGGADNIAGGVGDDNLSGGEGRDVIKSARDGGDVDRVVCGAGFDRASVDQFDNLPDNSCEKVTVIESPAPAPVPEPGA